MRNEYVEARVEARAIIERSESEPERWSYQGFGMLRYYITESRRLHIWNPSRRVDAVSDVHTHPWNFRSTVLCGALVDRVFVEREGVSPFMRQTIACGEGGGLVGDPCPVELAQSRSTLHAEGASYSHPASAIHRSEILEPGTVTVCVREFLEDTEHAFVYWPRREEWGSAEPRPATLEEIDAFTNAALEIWDR